MSTSQANHLTEQIVPQQQHQLPLKRQPPFSSMEPPFGDYHQFSSPALDLRLKEPEAIVVKSPALKRKSEKADLVAKSSDWNPSTGYVEAVGSPLQTPVSGNWGKAQKASRMEKSNRFGSQTAVSNVGSPSSNNLTTIGPCCYDSSLGLVTKKFINLIKNVEDSIFDLNKAVDTLEVTILFTNLCIICCDVLFN
ncbi:transcription factor E2FB-like isoform X1 [Camellia sinensis]|uniref:transcription factor E2FB-like isoform X1 n=1 Tax=Camellia sinensis TaxID=4442 RepID=UPI0010369B31|nr:transcription factor E2FB-like isoform X1 [Camellia sinensis]